MKRKSLLMVMALLLMGSLLAGCTPKAPSSEDPENTGEKPVYVIGLDDTFAPMGFMNDAGELVGFDIDLAKEIARRKNFDIRFQSIDWAMKETELSSKNIDMIWNGYTVTEERKQKVSFSEPYFNDGQIIVTLKDSPIETLDDLAGKTLALQGESSALDAVKKQENVYNSLGKIVEYATNTEVFQDLQAERCDVIVVDEVLGKYYMKNNGSDAFKILDADLGVEYMAVGFRKEDTALRTLINEGLKELQEDGTYNQIKNKWLAE